MDPRSRRRTPHVSEERIGSISEADVKFQPQPAYPSLCAPRSPPENRIDLHTGPMGILFKSSHLPFVPSAASRSARYTLSAASASPPGRTRCTTFSFCSSKRRIVLKEQCDWIWPISSPSPISRTLLWPAQVSEYPGPRSSTSRRNPHTPCELSPHPLPSRTLAPTPLSRAE